MRVRGHDPRPAGATVHPQVLEALQPAALALPVSDRVLDELKLARAAEVREGEDDGEDRLQPGSLALLWQKVHLQESLVGAALTSIKFGRSMKERILEKVFRSGD